MGNRRKKTTGKALYQMEERGQEGCKLTDAECKKMEGSNREQEILKPKAKRDQGLIWSVAP